MSLKARKKHSIQTHIDDRGTLTPVDYSILEFIPKRSFIVNNVPIKTSRGGHAHKNTYQALICISGKIDIVLDNTRDKKEFCMSAGEYINQLPMEWSNITFKTKNALLYVISSTQYCEKDYIRNYKEFKYLIESKK